jgi:8-oxo-dGTP pyrophosphatase MutT (NUDIX family)
MLPVARRRPSPALPAVVAYDGLVDTLDLRAVLRAALDPAPSPRPDPGDRLAAVLAPLILTPEPSLLFTERAADLSRHAGEMSFPGGLTEAGDRDLAATALRETYEEIGLDPALPDLVGALPAVHTVVSRILAVPFVGVLEAPPALTLSPDETAGVLIVPVSTLMSVEEERELSRGGGRVWRGWWYELGGGVVWGATGSMVHSLLDLVRKETT